MHTPRAASRWKVALGFTTLPDRGNNMKKLILTILAALALVPAMGQQAARDLAGRIMGSKARQVELAVRADTCDYFVLDATNGKIRIEGNNDNSLCMGLNYYLKHYAHVYVSWLAEQPVQLPKTLPSVPSPVRVQALVKDRFILNYCTFGYAMPWWKWRQWERFIDWMALNGITMPLAITGQESVWQEVWRSFGMSDDSIRAYFSGPAHLPWHRMANLDGFGGPLPQAWIDGQKTLQQRIVARERSLGMTPVLPAFAGHVPRQMVRMFPHADIQQLSSWCGFAPTYFLNSTDSLFPVVQQRFMEKQAELFGTDHIYGCDPFNEMNPPSYEPTYLASVSKNIYASMQAVDPDARWLQMSWVFYYKRKQWTPERLKAYLTAVPQDKMVLLDYFCEKTEVWRESDGFYGQPYIWCYLGNFGGNTMLVGDIRGLEEKLSKALQEAGPNMTGIGSTLESFDCSPQIYEYLFERAWQPDNSRNVDRVSEWTDMWADLRVGFRDEAVRAAWHLLVDSVYKDWSFYGLGTQLVARPSFAGHGTYYTKPYYSYDNETLFKAWNALCVDEGGGRDAYGYDRVNLGAQYLGNLFMDVRNMFTVAYRHRNVALMREQVAAANWVFDHTDRLLSSHESFLLGKWISDARSWGTTAAEKDYYEQQARTLLTIWGGPVLNDYANRMWGGLVKSYYAQRWNMFFDAAIKAVEEGRELDEDGFYAELSDFENNWVLRHDKLPSKAQGNTDKICWDILSDRPVNKAAVIYSHNQRFFPQSTLKDIYKRCFQDYFGPGHLITDSANCAEWIKKELPLLSATDNNPGADVAGPDANYFRVNLAFVKDGTIPLGTMVKALMQSCQVKYRQSDAPPITLEEWRCRWDMLMATFPAEVRQLPNYQQDSTDIAQMLERGDYVTHHSDIFNKAYNYHYRLIRMDVFNKEIFPRLIGTKK